MSQHFKKKEAGNICLIFTLPYSGIEKDKTSKNVINVKGACIVEVSVKGWQTNTSRHIFITWSLYSLHLIVVRVDAKICLHHKIKLWLLASPFLPSFPLSFLHFFHDMLAEIIFARTLRRQRLEERSLLFSLIKCFTPGHTKTPLPPSVADPNLPPPKRSSLEGTQSLIYKLFIIIYWSFCFVSFYSFSPQTLYFLDRYAPKYIGFITTI